MDYLFFSTMTHSNVDIINVSYDIACQWNKHLWERMSRYPTKIHLSHTTKVITFLVPKFHLPAHISACQTNFSFNLIKGMARTDGEAPERGWSNINPVATTVPVRWGLVLGVTPLMIISVTGTGARCLISVRCSLCEPPATDVRNRRVPLAKTQGSNTST
jgi:hypothetical protein